MYTLKVFSIRFFFHSFNSVIQIEVFNFDEVLFVFYFIYGSWFGYYLKNLCLIQGHKDFSFVVFVQKFYNLSFTFRSEVHFELICMYSMRCGWKFIILHINIHLLTIH